MADDPSPSTPSLISLGIIRKAHGVRGEASVEPWTQSMERFRVLERVFLQSPDSATIQSASIETVRIHGDRLLIKFREIGSPEDLRRFYEWTLAVDQADAIEPGPDEYFLHDLVGLNIVETGTRRRIGVVESADESGAGILLNVRREDGGSFDLPFATALCTAIDIEHREMIVDLPEGLERLDEINSIDLESVDDSDPQIKEDQGEIKDQGALAKSLRFDIVTIFPRMFDGVLAEGVVSRGIRSGALDVRVWDLRDFATDKHRSTDDEAYGGGVGMVLLPEPVFLCLDQIRATDPARTPYVVMLSPQGQPFRQEAARSLASSGWVVLLCGRYEGFDERIREGLANEEISVGDFVVSGGEVPAMLVLDATSRMVQGVVGDRNSVEADSFYNGLLDHPHYTRPAEFRGMRVPEVLLSGHAEKIRVWRKEQALRATHSKRPDLLDSAPLDDEARQLLLSIASRGSEENETKASEDEPGRSRLRKTLK